MAFCIECGAKAPDVAKFCPQCGQALVPVEPAKKAESKAKRVVATEKAPSKSKVTPKSKAGPKTEAKPKPKSETKSEATLEAKPKTDPKPLTKDLKTVAAAKDAVKTTVVDTTPNVLDAPKSKAGLLIGLSLIALVVAGGGAYAAGLFGGGDDTSKQAATETIIETPITNQDTSTSDDGAVKTKTVLSSYQNAIRTGRISDLGQFALNNPAHSLAQDAKDAAFASLQRQNSALAFSTFTKYFPEADLSQYTGPRNNDETVSESVSSDQVIIESEPVVTLTDTTFEAPTLRTSITTRVEDLSPFIEQGNIDYALSVIDEMLAFPDLTEDEATYLLNVRSRTETTVGITTPPVTPSESAPVMVMLDPVVTAPSTVDVQVPVAEAEVTLPVVEIKPTPTFDTPAKPIERFGAITPDAATKPGECDMSFGIDLTGKPINISATCTDAIFIAPAVETVGEWSYAPATLAGVAVVQDDLEVKIRFHLDDPN